MKITPTNEIAALLIVDLINVLDYGKNGYVLDSQSRVKPGKDTRTVKFDEFLSIIKSKDSELLSSNAWIFNNDA